MFPAVALLAGYCPSSPEAVHAQTSLASTAHATCQMVSEEILARIEANHDGSWPDPHNGGQYNLDSQSQGRTNLVIEANRLTGSASIPQGGPFMDKLRFTLTDKGGYKDGRHVSWCDVVACSSSQVKSVTDFSGGYCNVRNLFCGSDLGCTVQKHDIAFEETSIELSPGLGDYAGASREPERCIVTPSSEVATTAEGGKCPASSKHPHAQTELKLTADASCNDVATEIQARIAANQGGQWADPHNGGSYGLDSASSQLINAHRLTGSASIPQGGPFRDNLRFTLTPNGASCDVDACSVSQVTSVTDFSGGYCNVRNLFCGSELGCTVQKHDFSFTENSIDLSKGLPFVPGASRDPERCIVTATVV